MNKLALLLLLSLIGSSALAEYSGFLWEHKVQYNNCYAYALGVKDNRYLTPGDSSMKGAQVMSCQDYKGSLGLVNASINDGLRPTDSINDCKYDEQIVALVVNEGYDYHWYRLESDGIWTHKRGSKSPSNLDYSGNVITDLTTADHGKYEDFCSYFCVDYDVLKVKKTFAGY